jgi:hypothetical protein
VGAIGVAVALLVSACGSSSKSSSTHSSTTTGSATGVAFQAGPAPCRLLTSQVIVTTLKQQMAQVKKTESSCVYANRARTENVSISTAKTTRAGAEAAVSSAAHTAKAKVMHLKGIGDSGIAYLTTTKKLSIATSLFAKNGTIVFLNVDGPTADHLTSAVIALAKTAAGNTS